MHVGQGCGPYKSCGSFDSLAGADSKHGKVIYCKHPEKRPIYEMKVLKEYARLNEQRRPIVERIRERGSVYGE